MVIFSIYYKWNEWLNITLYYTVCNACLQFSPFGIIIAICNAFKRLNGITNKLDGYELCANTPNSHYPLEPSWTLQFQGIYLYVRRVIFFFALFITIIIRFTCFFFCFSIFLINLLLNVIIFVDALKTQKGKTKT